LTQFSYRLRLPHLDQPPPSLPQRKDASSQATPTIRPIGAAFADFSMCRLRTLTRMRRRRRRKKMKKRSQTRVSAVA
jgi:hypothetical protein